MRIDKLLAHSGYGTRKEVRKLLKAGSVKLNGEVVRHHGSRVKLDVDQVTVNDEVVNYKEFIYLMLHKPADYVSARFDREHLTVMDLLPIEYAHYSLSPVGRLDIDTEGFVLLTNDGQLNHLVTSPKKRIPKKYLVKLDGDVRESHVEIFKQGVILDDGYLTKASDLEIIEKKPPYSLVYLTITEGKYHQVKRMFRAVGMEVVYLKRVQIGPLTLDPSLSLGEVRELNKEEMRWINQLKEGETYGTTN